MKILVVDDQVIILNIITQTLSKKYDVVTAMSGSEALDLIKQQTPPNIILSDYIMPHMDGLYFLKEAKKIAPDAVQMMLTAHPSVETASEAIKCCDIFRYLIKPINEKELLEAIEDAVEHYEMIQLQKLQVKKTVFHMLEGHCKLLKQCKLLNRG